MIIVQNFTKINYNRSPLKLKCMGCWIPRDFISSPSPPPNDRAGAKYGNLLYSSSSSPTQDPIHSVQVQIHSSLPFLVAKWLACSSIVFTHRFSPDQEGDFFRTGVPQTFFARRAAFCFQKPLAGQLHTTTFLYHHDVGCGMYIHYPIFPRAA